MTVLNILGVLIIIWLGISSYIAYYVMNPGHESHADAVKLEIERGNLKEGEIDRWRFTEGEFAATDGVVLKTYSLFCGKETDRAVVISHGFGSRHEHMIKYARLYLARGYDVITYDQRNQGESGGKVSTMGFLEKYDLKGLVEWAREKYSVVGVHGESMGAATVMLTACLDDPPDFVVEDCGYDDCVKQIEYVVRNNYHLPPKPFLPCASAINYLVAGCFYRDVSPIRDIERREGLEGVPIFFIHGTVDKYVPSGSALCMYAKKRGVRALYMCEDAPHASSYAHDREKYKELLFDFLESNGF